MHHDLVNELDECFSPVDGIIAIDQMFVELPQLHQAIAPKRPQKRAGRTLKVYRGRFDWYPLGFSYVQTGTTLHVLELWNWDNRVDVDVVLVDEVEPTPYEFTESELKARDAAFSQLSEKLRAISTAEDDDSPFIDW
jgi:hypothetical protein